MQLTSSLSKNELESLESQYADKVRVHEADLAIQVKENKSKVLKNLLSEFGLTEITKADLLDLQKDYEYAQREVTSEIEQAVASAVKGANIEAQNQLSQLKSQHQVEIAQFQAGASAKDSQIAVLQQTIQDLRAQQDKDREAQIKIAEARSGEQTNINVGK